MGDWTWSSLDAVANHGTDNSTSDWSRFWTQSRISENSWIQECQLETKRLGLVVGDESLAMTWLEPSPSVS